jgi:hypothetical protein
MSEAQELVDYDWTISTSGDLLHHVTLPSDVEDIDDLWYVGPIAAACGRKLKAPRIPGVFTRMGAMRCERCCKALGLPLGKGSPKNDDECRLLLGWAAP